MIKKSNHTLEMAAEADSPFIFFIQEYGRFILVGFGVLIALLLLLFRLNATTASHAGNNYGLAEQAFGRFQELFVKDPAASQAALSQLDELMQAHPELHAKYDAPVAQILLYQSEVEAAQPYIQRTFDRVKKNDLSSYTDYSKATVAIDQANYPLALADATALKDRLIAGRVEASVAAHKSDDTLASFNLLRIANLENVTGSSQERLAAWQGFSRSIEGLDQATVNKLLYGTKSGSVTLFDFVEREKKAGK